MDKLTVMTDLHWVAIVRRIFKDKKALNPYDPLKEEVEDLLCPTASMI
jgi:hypothetical protein